MPTKYDYLTTTLLPLGSFTYVNDHSPVLNNITNKISTESDSKFRLDDVVNSIETASANKSNTTVLLLEQHNKPPMPEIIIEREKKGCHYTTIKWTDGTYTSVKASEDDAGERSAYMAFCAALAKKLYGSNSAVHRAVDRHMETYIEAEKKKADEAKRAKECEAEQAAHERALLREAKRLRLKEEAKAYNRAHKSDME